MAKKYVRGLIKALGVTLCPIFTSFPHLAIISTGLWGGGECC